MKKRLLVVLLLLAIILTACEKVDNSLDQNPVIIDPVDDDTLNETPSDNDDNTIDDDQPSEKSVLEQSINGLYELVINNSTYNGTFEEWVAIASPPTNDAKQVYFRIMNDHLKWQYEGDTEWNTLVNLFTLLGGVDSIEGYSFDKESNVIVAFNQGETANLGKISLVFEVQFLGFYDDVLLTQYVVIGTSAIPPKTPVVGGYKFIEWNQDYSNITKDIVIASIYQENE